MSETKLQQFAHIKYISTTELGISQIYLNEDKLSAIEKWFVGVDISHFEPLPVHDFGNGRLTLTDGHCRAFVAYKKGIAKIPVVYDTDDIVTSETGQMLYKNDIAWCNRFGLNNIGDLERRIISNSEYRDLWIGRCDKAYNLLTQTSEEQRRKLESLRKDLYLYGASEDLRVLYYEDINGNSFEFLLK